MGAVGRRDLVIGAFGAFLAFGFSHVEPAPARATSDHGLAARVQRLEDVEAIRGLMSRYAAAINQGWGGRRVNAGIALEIFTPDARWSSKDMGIEAVGVAAIAESLTRSTSNIEFAQHILLNPIITVTGDAASGSWLMWGAVRGAGGSRLVYLSEDVRYRRTAVGWRIETLDLQVAGVNPLTGSK